ncbi:secondary thiamine-phosphate synthase enzyme YjbQ [Acaryochloris sp. IP29b_bin.148]|uniref:secondary thiamine-phosphate synthase enzyme YjbQ n=1 Tax=Acaryochloris sp. IP29b_bin.148 TaxID=2969218 RepID=UPI00262B8F0C|nr:secondary thiamine-phosphate synthase enzyme YjbQ [Acaryochloris sp. IP29b_bin.148]
MVIVHKILDLETDQDIGIYNLSPQIQACIAESSVQNGQVLICSRHTTTALAINEYEERLLEDIKGYLRQLAPAHQRYLHNDLHLRDVPEDEPENAHSHLMAITLSSSEVVPIVAGQLALGIYQSVLLFELDGPRYRTVFVQILGE